MDQGNMFGMGAVIVFFVIVFIFLLIFAAKSIRIIQPNEKGVLSRLGQYRKTLDSGLNMIVPFFDDVIRVNISEIVVDVPSQEVITRDNVVVTVDAVIYFEVTDPFKHVFNIQNFYLAITKLAQTNLRNVIGEMSLDETLTSRENINTRLRTVLDDATDKWGTRISRVEIQRIEPPRDVTESMHKQMKAEREKRAAILEAEGFKQAAILKAEGEQRSNVLHAEGQKQAAILEAEGKASAIQKMADAEKYQKETVAIGEAKATYTVFRAIHEGQPTNDLIAIKYLESLIKIADGKANKIFLPYEASALLSTLGGVSDLLKDKTNIDSAVSLAHGDHSA